MAGDDRPNYTNISGLIQNLDESSSGPLTISGTVVVDFGDDGPGTIELNGQMSVVGSGSPLFSGGQEVLFTNTLTRLTANTAVDGTLVFELDLDSSSGNFTYTQYLPFDHSDITDPDDVIAVIIGVFATDADGDVTAANIRINTSDDAPSIVDDNVGVDEGATVAGNIIADGTASFDTENRIVTVDFNSVSTNINAMGQTEISGTFGSLFVQADGTYSYVASDDDPEGVDAFLFTVQDFDGDTDTATLSFTVTGVDDDDTFLGTAAVDTFDGGVGFNTISYANSTALTFDFGVPANNTGDATGDILINFQRVLGSAEGDILRGDSGNNFLDGGAGDDSLDGGSGIDTAGYNGSSSAVTVNLATGTGTGGDAQGDTLTNIENLTGSAFNDVLVGDAGDNILEGGAGADNIDGGSGIDTAGYNGSSSAVTVYLARSTGTGGDAQGDTLANIENLTGSDFDDVLVGGTGNNTLSGGNGDDYLLDLSGGDDAFFGEGGNDTLQGSGGADSYDGGTGIDEVRYNNSGSAVNVNLNTGVAFGGDAVGDTFNSVENLVGSQFNDILTGDDGVNRLEGFLGDDTLQGGLGADILWGGLGFDTADYSDSSVGVDARLLGTGTGGTAEGDVMIYVEGIIGSDFADNLVGGGATVTLNGEDGDDILFDYSANATLIGGNGNDFMQGGIGGDAYDGGNGIDTVSFANAVGAVTANLATGTGSGNDAAGDTYANVENLLGSANSDTFIGDDNDNNLNGQGGIDFLMGGLGNDTLTGGTGGDLFQYDTTTWGFDIVTDFQNGTDSIDLRGSGLTFTDFTEVTTGSGMITPTAWETCKQYPCWA